MAVRNTCWKTMWLRCRNLSESPILARFVAQLVFSSARLNRLNECRQSCV